MSRTAVEWLVNQIKIKDYKINDYYLFELLHKEIEQAKEMEKEQIKDAYLRGIENYDSTFKRKEK